MIIELKGRIRLCKEVAGVPHPVRTMAIIALTEPADFVKGEDGSLHTKIGELKIVASQKELRINGRALDGGELYDYVEHGRAVPFASLYDIHICDIAVLICSMLGVPESAVRAIRYPKMWDELIAAHKREREKEAMAVYGHK